METINKNLSDQIKFFRNQLGWTQEELAEKVGVTFQAVSKWENGKTAPDIMLLPTLAKIFSCTIDELFSMPTQAKEQDVLPWQDDGMLRAVVFQGRTLLNATDGVSHTFTLELIGDVKNVHSECNVSVRGSVFGSCSAGADIAVGESVTGSFHVGKEAAIGGSVTGACNVGQALTLGGDIHGDICCDIISVGGDVESKKIKGNVECYALHCDKVEGNVTVCKKDT